MASTSIPVSCQDYDVEQDYGGEYTSWRIVCAKRNLENLLPFTCLILQVKKIESGHLVKMVSQILKVLEEDTTLPELLIQQLNEKPDIPESDRNLMLTMVNMRKRNDKLMEEVLDILQVKEILEKINLLEAEMKRYLDKTDTCNIMTDICNMRDDVIGYIDRQRFRQIVRNLLQTIDKLKDGLMFFFEIAMETKVFIKDLGVLVTFSEDCFFSYCSNKIPDCYPISKIFNLSRALFYAGEDLQHMNENIRCLNRDLDRDFEDIKYWNRDFEEFCSCIESTVKSFFDAERYFRKDILQVLRKVSNTKRLVMEINDQTLGEKGIPSGVYNNERHVMEIMIRHLGTRPPGGMFPGIFCGYFKFNNRKTKRINGIRHLGTRPPSSMFPGIFCGYFKFNNRKTERINGQKLNKVDSKLGSTSPRINGPKLGMGDVKLESTSPWCSSQDNSNQKEDIVVGLEGMLKMTATVIHLDPSGLEILTIVGMAGIGKSTLANEIFHNPIISSHFDCRAWVTVREDYKVKELFYDLLCSVSLTGYEKDERSTTDIAKNLNSCLKGKRYLIVIDNMLSVETLDAVRQFFPDDKNESRILLTTKSMQLATAANPNSTIFCMNLLDECQSWEFLKKELFGRKSCPPQLLDTGKQIAKKCLGLPSALAHVANGLSRILTHDWWLVIENSLNSLVCCNPEEYQKILSLDFDQLSRTWRFP